MSKASRCLDKLVFSRHNSANTFWGKGETTLLKDKRHGSQETFIEPPMRPPLLRKSRYNPNLTSTSKYGFSPDLGGKNGGDLSMRMQVILDSSFRPSGFSPHKGWEEKESSGTGLASAVITPW